MQISVDTKKKFNNFGRWYEGDRFCVRVGTDGHDSYPNNFKCLIQIKDKSTRKMHERIGIGQFIGNFSPIWISWEGQKILVERLLDTRS